MDLQDALDVLQAAHLDDDDTQFHASDEDEQFDWQWFAPDGFMSMGSGQHNSLPTPPPVPAPGMRGACMAGNGNTCKQPDGSDEHTVTETSAPNHRKASNI